MINNEEVYEERYYGPLIQTPVSLGYSLGFPFIGLPISIFLYFAGGFEDKIGIIKIIFLSCIIINIVSLILGMLKAFSLTVINVITYFWISLVFLSILIGLDFIGLLMVVSNGSPSDANTIYSTPLSIVYVIIMMVIFISALLSYSWYYLPKNQGKVWTFNQWGSKHTRKTQWKTNFAITFGLALLAPAILTGHIANIFGLLIGVVLTLTLPSLVVDALYAAYYVYKHPDYEE